MKIEMATTILPIIEVGTYGTNLDAYDVQEDYIEDFHKAIIMHGTDKINEVLSEDSIVEKLGKMTASNVLFKSPKWYNYQNDWLEFNLEIENEILFMNTVDVIYNDNDKDFFKWADENFGSHPGFISFAPTNKDKFIKYIKKDFNEYDFSRAVALIIMYTISKEISETEMERHQRDFEDDVWEYINENGMAMDAFYDEE